MRHYENLAVGIDGDYVMRRAYAGTVYRYFVKNIFRVFGSHRGSAAVTKIIALFILSALYGCATENSREALRATEIIAQADGQAQALLESINLILETHPSLGMTPAQYINNGGEKNALTSDEKIRVRMAVLKELMSEMVVK
jgi:hypothetical protein